MKAAISARQDNDLVVAGRTSALTIANFDEAVKRAKAKEAAGLDAIFLAGGMTVDAVEIVSSAIKIPLILGSGGGQPGDPNWLAAHRVCVALEPGHEDGGAPRGRKGTSQLAAHRVIPDN
jgi:oxaloacetate decarboxylase